MTVTKGRVAAVATVRNEADIIGRTVRHLAAQGVDGIFVVDHGSTDGTADILADLEREGLPVVWASKEDPIHRQQIWIDELAFRASEEIPDLDWILPFDADEFIISMWLEQTIKESLETRIPDDVIIMQMIHFAQRNWREVNHLPKQHFKVAYRWHPDARIGPGNHKVEHPLDNGVRMRPFFVREIQYRGAEHFVRKVRQHCATIDPALLKKEPRANLHHLQYEDATDDELVEIFHEVVDKQDWSWDPIPHVSHLYDDLETGKTLTELFDERAPEGPMWSDVKGHIPRFVDLVEETDATLILELGVNTGVSTIAFLHALEQRDKGILISCDIADPRVPRELRDHPQWRLQIGDDLEIEWSAILPVFDLLYIDTSHTFHHTLAELKKFAPLVKEGGAIALHDAEQYPDQTRAVRHWAHWWEEQGRKVTREEWHSHDAGLQVLWV